jgi:hypothetical protein
LQSVSLLQPAALAEGEWAPLQLAATIVTAASPTPANWMRNRC